MNLITTGITDIARKDGSDAMAHYKALMEPLESITGDLVKTNTQATWSQENINKAILEAADTMGASSKDIIGYKLAIGELTEEQAATALREV